MTGLDRLKKKITWEIWGGWRNPAQPSRHSISSSHGARRVLIDGSRRPPLRVSARALQSTGRVYHFRPPTADRRPPTADR